MALIYCPECGQSVSTCATMCPHCGFNVSEFYNKEKHKLEFKKENEQNIYDENYNNLYKEVYDSIELPHKPIESEFAVKSHFEFYQIIIILFLVSITIISFVLSYTTLIIVTIILDIIYFFYTTNLKKSRNDLAKHNYEVAIKKYESIMKNPEEWKNIEAQKVMNQEKSRINSISTIPSIKPVSNQPHCPTCGSPNIEKISIGKKMKGSFFFGFMSKDVRSTFHCKNCGYKW